MQALHSIMLALLLAPAAPPPGGVGGAKATPPAVGGPVKPALTPLLSDAALAALAKAAGVTKAPTIRFDERITLSPHAMSSRSASIDYACVGKIYGTIDIAYWYQYFIEGCPATEPASAMVQFPAAAGRVYVVNCQASDNTWTLTRHDGGTPTNEVKRMRSVQPSMVVAATKDGTLGVRFGLADAERGNNPQYYLGKCQIARVAT